MNAAIEMRELTEDEVADLKEAFAMFDGDGRGRIDKHQLLKVMRKLGQNPPLQEIEDMMDSVATAELGDRRIDINDFLVLMRLQLYEYYRRSEESEVCCLPPIDPCKGIDPDKRIDRNELKRIMKRLGQALSDAEIDAMMEETGPDANGTISFLQFKDLMEC